MTGASQVAADRAHLTAVQRQWNGFRASCSACGFYEQHSDETTAHREAERHRRTAKPDSGDPS